MPIQLDTSVKAPRQRPCPGVFALVLGVYLTPAQGATGNPLVPSLTRPHAPLHLAFAAADLSIDVCGMLVVDGELLAAVAALDVRHPAGLWRESSPLDSDGRAPVAAIAWRQAGSLGLASPITLRSLRFRVTPQLRRGESPPMGSPPCGCRLRFSARQATADTSAQLVISAPPGDPRGPCRWETTVHVQGGTLGVGGTDRERADTGQKLGSERPQQLRIVHLPDSELRLELAHLNTKTPLVVLRDLETHELSATLSTALDATWSCSAGAGETMTVTADAIAIGSLALADSGFNAGSWLQGPRTLTVGPGNPSRACWTSASLDPFVPAKSLSQRAGGLVPALASVVAMGLGLLLILWTRTRKYP